MALATTKTPTPTRRRVPRAQRQDQMIGAATRIFARRGYADASMDEIAAACGVTKPMLYAYFDSKEGLLVACVERGEQALEDAVSRAALGVGAPERRLWAGLLAVFGFFDEHPDLFQIAYGRGSITPRLADATARGRARMAGLLTALIADSAAGLGVDPDAARESEPLAHALTGATIATLAWAATRPDEPRELHALRLMNFAWMGLGQLARGELWVPPAD